MSLGTGIRRAQDLEAGPAAIGLTEYSNGREPRDAFVNSRPYTYSSVKAESDSSWIGTADDLENGQCDTKQNDLSRQPLIEDVPASDNLGYKDPNPFESSSDYEPIFDGSGLPRLDFKPVGLRRWFLAASIFVNIIIVVIILALVRFQQFQVSEKASYLGLRYIPGILGALTQIGYSQTFHAYGRMLPCMRMAEPKRLDDTCPPASQTILAPYHWDGDLWICPHLQREEYVLNMGFFITVIAYIIPPLGPLLFVTMQDPLDTNQWLVIVSAGIGYVLTALFSLIAVTTFCVLCCTWNRPTGLMWDPVSLADMLVLWHKSDFLSAFQGWEYRRGDNERYWKRLRRATLPFKHVKLRLGWWRHKSTGEICYGIRRWPKGTDLNVPSVSLCTPSMTTAHDNSSAATKKQSAEGAERLLDHPESCYRHFPRFTHRTSSNLCLATSGALAVLCIWIYAKDELDYCKSDPVTLILAIIFPQFAAVLFLSYWYTVDIFFRLSQPFEAMLHPAPATENLLLRYQGTLPGITSIKAVLAGHWRIAFASTMLLLQRILHIFAGAVYVLTRYQDDGTHNRNVCGARNATASQNATSSEDDLQDGDVKYYTTINLNGTCLAVIFIISIIYCLAIPWGVSPVRRRLPWKPASLADYALFFYDSGLIHDDTFRLSPKDTGIPGSQGGKRVMETRLQEGNRLYAFGLFSSPSGMIRLGVDDAYLRNFASRIRTVAPVMSPEQIFYESWYLRLIYRLPFFHRRNEEDMQQDYDEVKQAQEQIRMLLRRAK